jgi:hypothetical protein
MQFLMLLNCTWYSSRQSKMEDWNEEYWNHFYYKFQKFWNEREEKKLFAIWETIWDFGYKQNYFIPETS